MKVTLRHAVAGSVALVLIGVIVGVAAWWPRTSSDVYASGPDSPRLVVEPGWTTGGPLADMHGTLGVNSRGCVTLGGDVMLAQEGSRVTPDGKHVSFPGYAPIRFGSAMTGGGGYRAALQTLPESGLGPDLVHALTRCMGGDPSVSVVQFWLARD